MEKHAHRRWEQVHMTSVLDDLLVYEMSYENESIDDVRDRIKHTMYNEIIKHPIYLELLMMGVAVRVVESKNAMYQRHEYHLLAGWTPEEKTKYEEWKAFEILRGNEHFFK